MKKEEKTEKEIEYWSKHLELDKFNYGTELSAFIGLLSMTLSIVIGLMAMIMSYNQISPTTKSVTIFLLGLGFLYFLRFKLIKNHKKRLDQHLLSFFIRERMIQERYEKLHNISKDELNIEFEELKRIVSNSKESSRENLIKEYYKNKKSKPRG